MKNKTTKLPIFPDFAPVSPEHKITIDQLTKDFPPYVDFMYSNLSSWNKNGHRGKFSICNDNLVINLLETLQGKNPVSTYSIIGKNNLTDTVDCIFKGGIKVLSSVPEEVVNKIQGAHNYNIAEQRDNFEYIYDMSLLEKLAGNSLEHRKRAYRRFKKNYPEYSFVQVSLSDTKNISDINALNYFWMEKSGSDVSDNIEHVAFNKYINHSVEFNHYAFCLYIGDVLAAYIILEPYNNEYVVATFAKSNRWDYFGAGVTLLVETSKALREFGYKYMNFDIDMGNPNLRMYKSLWRPIKFLKKYKVTPKKTIC